MSDATTSAVERFLDRTARKLSGARLHPVEILQRVRSAYEAAAANGFSANSITIDLSEDDYRTYAPMLGDLEFEVVALVEEIRSARRWRAYGERIVTIQPSADVANGEPRVAATFVGIAARPDPARQQHAAREIVRLNGLTLVISTGERVPLTHVPFSIGRGEGCDLVIPSLAVSRHHAEIRASSNGVLLLVDSGSRNGIESNGERVQQLELRPGTRFVLGDTTLELMQLVRRNG